MEQMMPKILDLIALLGVLTIIAVFLIALVRPEQLPTIAALVKGIVYALLRRDVDVEVRTKQKRKNDDDHRSKN